MTASADAAFMHLLENFTAFATICLQIRLTAAGGGREAACLKTAPAF